MRLVQRGHAEMVVLPWYAKVYIKDISKMEASDALILPIQTDAR